MWIFRGQASADWALETTFERFAMAGLSPRDMWDNRENQILQEFERRAHLVLPSPPRVDDKVEWLSVIQHYGGPTRLLDFTHSIYVATYFAVADCLDCDAAVWAVNGGELARSNIGDAWLKETPGQWNMRQVTLAETILRDGATMPGILQVEPARLNERMSIQKGTFLFPRDIRQPFMANLNAAIGIDVADRHKSMDAEMPWAQFAQELLNGVGKYVSVKFILDRKTHEDAYYDLMAMNIDASTLFPGLEGFARSLVRYLRMPAFVRYPERIRPQSTTKQ
jgi:hypothetical protein